MLCFFPFSNISIISENYLINVTGSYERITREDGKLHFHLIDFCLNLDNQAQATTKFQNLFIRGEGDGEFIMYIWCYKILTYIINAKVRFFSRSHS